MFLQCDFLRHLNDKGNVMSVYLTLNLRNKFLQYQIVICLMIYCRIPIYITDGYNVLLKCLTDVQLKNIAKLLIKA